MRQKFARRNNKKHFYLLRGLLVAGCADEQWSGVLPMAG